MRKGVEIMERMNRRQFLNGSIRGAAGVSLGVAAFSLTGRKVLGANNKVVLGLIGAGARGSLLIEGMTKSDYVETKYVCEVDGTRGRGTIRNLEKIQGYAPKRVIDMREVFDDKDVDAVVVTTPGQWHALATVWACQADKDVYVEKCVSMSIWEGRKMIEAARKYNRIVQCGMQNRSMPESLSARDYIKSGKLGRVVSVKVNNTLGGGPWRPPPDSDPPAGLDWDRWLGPAPQVPYNLDRHRGYMNYFDYSSGVLARTGCHTLDLARMVIGDPAHPKSVYAAGGRIAFKDKRETPDMAAVTYDYGDFIMTMDHAEFMPYTTRTIDIGDVCYGDKFPDWRQCPTRIEIYGTERMMYLGPHGGGWQVFEKNGKVVAQEYGFWDTEPHWLNFLECVRSRKRPMCDIEQGHYSATLAHLANTALRVGNKQLIFDTKTETFLNNDANRLLKPAYRKHYRIDEQV